jgi:hypothetical protein
MLPEPIPPGFQELQERAQLAKTSAELTLIIQQMNALLDQFESTTYNWQATAPNRNSVKREDIRS